MHRTEGKTMAIQKALETLCYFNGCGSVAIESAQIHVETGGAVARQLLDAPSLYLRGFPGLSQKSQGFPPGLLLSEEAMPIGNAPS
jgi:hypothetical protein